MRGTDIATRFHCVGSPYGQRLVGPWFDERYPIEHPEFQRQPSQPKPGSGQRLGARFGGMLGRPNGILSPAIQQHRAAQPAFSRSFPGVSQNFATQHRSCSRNLTLRLARTKACRVMA